MGLPVRNMAPVQTDRRAGVTVSNAGEHEPSGTGLEFKMIGQREALVQKSGHKGTDYLAVDSAKI